MAHQAEAPPVIRVEEDQVRFDAKPAKCGYAFVYVLEISDIETREVPVIPRTAPIEFIEIVHCQH